MRHAVLVVLGVCLLGSLGVAKEAVSENPVEKALKKPPATGLLITFVTKSGQARLMGIVPGDVLVSYDGKSITTTGSLLDAMKAAGQKQNIECVVVRGAERLTRGVAPGRLGVNLLAVVKDQPPAPLPARTIERIDLSSLEAPREVWFGFSLDGKTKVGFEHGEVRVEDGVLHLHHEVAFDGGEQLGVNHEIVRATVDVTNGFELESTRYVSVPNIRIGEGKRVRSEGGDAVWETRWPPVGGKPQISNVAIPNDLPIVPSYLVPTMVSFLPREPNACFHYRPLDEGVGRIDLPSALFVIGEEEMAHDGATTKAWKVELRKLGAGKLTTWWVAPNGKVLKTHYGQAWAHATTKEKALADLPEKIAPKTTTE